MTLSASSICQPARRRRVTVVLVAWVSKPAARTPTGSTALVIASRPGYTSAQVVGSEQQIER
jgi:hypothetical protein